MLSISKTRALTAAITLTVLGLLSIVCITGAGEPFSQSCGCAIFLLPAAAVYWVIWYLKYSKDREETAQARDAAFYGHHEEPPSLAKRPAQQSNRSRGIYLPRPLDDQ